ncbi:env protein [Simian immunodeficiency virus SIV-mnd 2]|uniref:Envelope glycoprotein gp160 n=1 Tax=Simian immunodeficiency virus SIV-mnd 2 TaxID=159122 RepID=Q8AII4_SIV|nr:env protein [Simian immunodeficiency virus SIV-mnd 2]AAN85712.1 env protein [Simian immunodeficiency virus SIV-mnd 2]
MLRYIILGIIVGLGLGNQWVTVYYGTPKWHKAETHLFCATENDSLWVTTSCVPSLLHYEEQPIPNITWNFTGPMEENEVVMQAWGAISSMIDAVLKPCVKLTPYCVKMQCTKGKDLATPIPTTSTTTTTTTTKTVANTTELDIDTNNTETTTQQNRVCKFNTTGLCRDCKLEIEENFRYEDVTCTNGTNNTYSCYMTQCNTSVITQDCNKASTDEIKFRLCAPPGYVLLRCLERLNVSKKCTNITAVQCTQPLPATTSTMCGSSGTKHDYNELIQTNTKKGKEEFHDHKYVYRVDEKYNLQVVCRRKGNRSVISTPSATGLIFYSGLEPGKNLKKGMCQLKGQWGIAMHDLAIELRKIDSSIWRNVTKGYCKGLKRKENRTGCALKTIKVSDYTTKGEPGAETIMLLCGGEYFFCNWTKIWRTWNDQNSSVWYPWMSCNIRQIIDDWHKVGKKIYMPPVSGFNNEIRCSNDVTEMFFEVQKTEEGYIIKFVPQDEVQNRFTAVGAHYQLVKVDPIGFAPTEVARYHLPEARQKRGAVLLGMFGLLGLAGSTMGSVAVALTVQSQALLNGIVEQQKVLLSLIDQHSELLKLTIWGVKNLQARLTALEDYVADQARLSMWGCSFAQVCHTHVPWPNDSITPNWTSETWLEWDKRVTALTDNMTVNLQKAYELEQKNIYELEKLGDWTSWASWFDFTWWLKYVKIGLLIVIVIIVLRILACLWSVLGKFRQGYRPLPYVFKGDYLRPHNLKQPGKEREEEPDSEKQSTKSDSSKVEFGKPWSKEQIRDWLKTSRGYVWLKNLQAVIEYGWQELKTAGGKIFKVLQGYAQGLWSRGHQWGLSTAACFRAIARGIINIPRRIRQGAEVLLN